ncbi:hypothetical protein [Sphingopyxis sp. GC21]|uniref:hypothetical protein n=1 Tax=Sphingopyxis sp. GC21 TaxID=2933562 RepID=UPI0021E3C4DF|nr:hypothetical protein [Sphingopyxis sp. GC21]
MEENEISASGWVVVVAATIAGMAMGTVLLGPPGAIAMSVICGRGVYSHCKYHNHAR